MSICIYAQVSYSPLKHIPDGKKMRISIPLHMTHPISLQPLGEVPYAHDTPLCHSLLDCLSSDLRSALWNFQVQVRHVNLKVSPALNIPKSSNHTHKGSHK